uniref:alpha-D-xyloside xylohydrolase n=1 Tax=Talaromyces marneffei PM1 TaxID=1077442 RepID=A0A093VPU6_TALMA
MKFTDGMWCLREGITIDWMSNVERSSVEEDVVHLLLNKYQRHRGDTLNSPTISATVTSPLEGIIGVKLVHWAGEVDSGPHYQIASATGHSKIDQTNDSVHIQSGPASLKINTAPNELDFAWYGDSGQVLTGHSFRSIGYVRDRTTEKTRWSDGLYVEHQGYMLAELNLGVNEKLYGLGERFGPFVKNGQRVDIWNEDGGTSSELAYKNIPFYLSSKGYGVFVVMPAKVNISVPGQELEYFIIFGGTPKEVLRRYTALTGQPSLVPAWSYNLWLTTSFTTSYDEKTVTGFLDGFRDRDIPLGVFHFDAFWMKSYQWCDLQFDEDYFPNATAYLKRLKERGLKISVWLNSYVGQASPLFKEGKEKGYFIKRLDGSVWQWDMWQAGMAIVDFTNPEASAWYTSHLMRLMDMGVDSFKTDFAERIPFQNVKFHDGSDPVRMHNYYSILYNKAVYQAMISRVGRAKSLLFARSTAPGGQAYPVHWGGDCESTFEAMAESLRGGLSLMLSGYIFWASDIGGFEGTPPPALYKRWVQFGLLSSHSRLHGSSSYRVPWIYGEDCSDVLRDCVKRKISLTPYLMQEALNGHRTGVPLMRAMFLEFPHDLNTYAIDTQYMFGSNLLVAPVFTEEGTVTFYVPRNEKDDSKGKWVSWFDHDKTYEPGQWYTEKHDFSSLPILIRPGTVTAINTKLKTPEDDAFDGLQFIVNGILEPGEGKIEIVDPKDAHEVLKSIDVNEIFGAGKKAVKIHDWNKV